ncbi:MAG: hypothetical protein ACHQRL_01380 [Gemmatimonadales bacterium]
MPTDARDPTTDRPRTRVPKAIFVKALLPALLATLLFVFLFTRASSKPHPVVSNGMMRVTLSQKDASFRPIPRAAGGATGVVWYVPTAPGLRFQLRAYGLRSGRRYVLEMQVDDAIYTVASYTPDTHGNLAIDTTITQFQEGVCVGANYDPPRPVLGHHKVKFWIKNDGSPASGTMPGTPPNAPGAQLACHGNGDGNYNYLLLENEVADFTGR